MSCDDQDATPPDVSERLSDPGVHHLRHDGDGEDLATALGRAVAAIEGVRPTDLDRRVGNVVDTDALEAVFGWGVAETPRGADRVVFDLAGYVIAVYRSGDVVVTEPGAYAGNN